MTTKAEITAALKAEYPVLKIGNDEDGYTELDAKAYEAKIAEWAEAAYNTAILEAAEAAKVAAATSAVAKLEAIGLTAEEIAALRG